MILLYLTMVYLVMGMVFSLPFLFKWIHLIDESIDSSWLSKLLFLPGSIVFWPVLLLKYRRLLNK